MDNTIDKLYDMFDYAAPKDDDKSRELHDVQRLWNTEDAACSGGESITGIEWHHISSVTAGTQENIIKASRELNTIWSFAHDGSGKKWQFSLSLDSDYLLESDVDMFYQPHNHVNPAAERRHHAHRSRRRAPGMHAREDGRLLLARDRVRAQGVGRACAGSSSCRTRSTTARRATWASETQDLWNEIGGSVYKLANGHYLIGFMSVSAQELWDERATCLAFEVDIAQLQRAQRGAQDPDADQEPGPAGAATPSGGPSTARARPARVGVAAHRAARAYTRVACRTYGGLDARHFESPLRQERG